MSGMTTIILDMCDALIPGSFSRVADSLGRRLSVPVESIVPAFSVPIAQDALLGQVTEESYFKEVIQCSGWAISVEELILQIRRLLFDYQNCESRAIAEELALQHRMVLVSDIWREAAEYIVKTHQFLTHVFPTRIFSFESGSLKRDSNGLRSILAKYEIDTHSALFIDDSQLNVSNARALGLKSIHYKNAIELRTQLEAMNVLGQLA